MNAEIIYKNHQMSRKKTYKNGIFSYNLHFYKSEGGLRKLSVLIE